MVIGLIIILLLTLSLPFFIEKIEHNLEYFLFVMGISAAIIAKVMSVNFIVEKLQNPLIYMITAAVFFAGLLFKLLNPHLKRFIDFTLNHISLKLFVFLIIVILGLLSSAITAIIASLLLVEIVNALPIHRKNKIEIDIIACFSIGLGAALTPVGEPLATIVVSKMHENFGYMFNIVGEYIIPGIIALGILGVFFIGRASKVSSSFKEELEEETFKGIFIRTFKIFIFMMALEFLGSGFEPLINKYVIHLNTTVLYLGNMLSAILDNATLAAAEISPKMDPAQIKAILMGLLISGGMLIPGNIPNIISAGKLKISSKEWAKLGLPLGFIFLGVYYVIIFII